MKQYSNLLPMQYVACNTVVPFRIKKLSFLDWSKYNLKGQCHEIFDFRFFSWISFPQAPEYLARAVSNLFKNLPQVSLTPVTNLQRWPAAHIFVQICKFLGSIRNCNSANFWDMRVPKFQICKFCWWASLQIFHHKTERIKHLF